MTDKDFLLQAIELAKKSHEPEKCGVLLIRDNRMIAEAYNSQHVDEVAVNHAEIKAIVMANRRLNSRKLNDVTAYCSCEPCAMCLTALSYAKVGRIVYDKSMTDMFPNDPQSKLDTQEFIKHLNFVPKLEQLRIT